MKEINVSTLRSRCLALVLTVVGGLLFGLLGAVPALAAPSFEVSPFSHSPSTIHANDEGSITYSLKVHNTALSTFEAGAQVACNGAAPPEGTKTWVNSATTGYIFSFQWVRDGSRLTSVEDIAHGSQSKTYTLQTADAGHAVQCMVKGTNGSGSGSFVAFSQPRVVVEPSGGHEPPRAFFVGKALNESPGSRRPAITGEANEASKELTCTAPAQDWSNIAIATTTLGSNVLTNVTTATSKGTFTEKSNIITEVGISSSGPITGTFRAGMAISGANISAGTTIVRVISATELELSVASTVSGSPKKTQEFTAGPQPLEAGQAISGPGIPAGTTISSVNGQSVTLSAATTATAIKVPLSVPSAGVGTWSFRWLRNGVELGNAHVTATTTNTSKYQVQAADVATKAVFQCEVLAENSGGTAAVESAGVPTIAPAPVFVAGGTDASPSTSEPGLVELASATSGTFKVELQVPPGLLASAAAGTGWTCEGDGAGVSPRPVAGAHLVTCTRSEALQPGAETPVLAIEALAEGELPLSLVAVATASGGGALAATTATDEIEVFPATPFQVESFVARALKNESGSEDETQAGGHPFSATAQFEVSTHTTATGGGVAVIAHVKDARADLPPGFIGNPQATPQLCDSVAEVAKELVATHLCPEASAVGVVNVRLDGSSSGFSPILYAVKPEHGSPAQFAFSVPGIHLLITLTPKLRAGKDGYAVSIIAPSAPKDPALTAVTVTLCGYGARRTAGRESWEFAGCKNPDEVGANPVPLLTNPTQCSATPPVTTLAIDTWEHPDSFVEKPYTSPNVTGCESVPFSPRADLHPTSGQADSPTGLDVFLSVPSKELETAGAITQGELKKATVTLPEGMAVNPAAADGLAACTQAQLGMHEGVPDDEPAHCPQASKVGTVEVETPLLGPASLRPGESPQLQGSVYLAKQGENPFHLLLGLYLVAESEERGIVVKIPGRVETDPATGRLVSVFDNNPQVPFSSLELHFTSGNRAPLLNPPKCGEYSIKTELTPYSAPNEVLTRNSTFEVTSGPRGSACPAPDLKPKLSAGLQNPVAGSISPFVMDLSREDGTQRFKGLDLTLPPGLTAYLKGIPSCPDSALAAVSEAEGTGQSQIDSPSCPSASSIGSVSVGAGGGSNPFYVNTGKAYLAGPYKGAPLSIAIVTPAVAGPFDLGSVVVRAGAYVNPETAQITVKSDPIPTILHGIPLDLRDIRVSIDRPAFTLAPTNCEEMTVSADVSGEGGGRATASNRFQVGECAALGFKPHLRLSLKGGTRRGDHPALTATLTQPKGQANIGAVSVSLPHSEFLAQEHIKTVCTRVQFAADACPKGSIYGYAEAQTPLLGYKLSGPVYLRSSSHSLPDLVVALRGPSSQPIEVDLDGRVDSHNGGIRNSFEVVPDAPVSSFTLKMQGAKKGLLVNSRDICKSVNRATVRMEGQNGKGYDARPVLRAGCRGEDKRKRFR
jgi:hypothetical protein